MQAVEEDLVIWEYNADPLGEFVINFFKFAFLLCTFLLTRHILVFYASQNFTNIKFTPHFQHVNKYISLFCAKYSALFLRTRRIS